MSFLRHKEIYQVSHTLCADNLSLERAQPHDRALAHRLDESPVGYSWRVALQHCPFPLHQPAVTLRQWRAELQVFCRPAAAPHLNLLSRFSSAPHTHLVRGGSLMLEPTPERPPLAWLRSESCAYPGQ